MAFGKCECCEVLKEQVKHLQGLLDQTMNLIAPKTGEPPVEPSEEQEAKDKVQYGEA